MGLIRDIFLKEIGKEGEKLKSEYIEIYVKKQSIFRIFIMDFSADAESTVRLWKEIALRYAVPTSLFKHQVDTITLLMKGCHVFCSSPTGSGKTLAQLATILFTSGRFCKNCIESCKNILQA